MPFSRLMTILREFLADKTQSINPVWADEGAVYSREISIDISVIVPFVAAPHNVDNVRSVPETAGTVVHEGLIGTCTNGRIEDLRAAAEILKGHRITEGFQLSIIPASTADIAPGCQ